MHRTNLLLSACCVLTLSALHALPQPAQTAKSPVEKDDRTVETGKVKWHKSLADAQSASEKSGKPVLLFQMIGRLDQQFV